MPARSNFRSRSLGARKHRIRPGQRRRLIIVMIPVVFSIAWLCFRRPPAPIAASAFQPETAWIPAHPSDRWQCIVIHHSASDTGSAERFDQWHRDKGWDELGYHFVIGNGTDTSDGQVEVGPRWLTQKHGAHCKTPDEFYNQHGIGICLVGNFDNYEPSAAQIRSLVSLCHYLCTSLHIPPDHIYTHGGITGRTDCPGKLLDVELIRSKVEAAIAY